AMKVAEGFAQVLAAKGPAPTPWRYASDADLGALLPRVQAQQPGAILVAGEVEAVRRLRVTLPAVPIFFGGADGLEALQRHPETQSGVYLAVPFVADAEAPRARAFVKQYQAVLREEPTVAAALAYESAAILFAALRQTDNPSNRAA